MFLVLFGQSLEFADEDLKENLEVIMPVPGLAFGALVMLCVNKSWKMRPLRHIIYISIYIYIQISICIYTYIHMCIYHILYTYTCKYVHTYVYIHIYIYPYTNNVCMYIHAYLHNESSRQAGECFVWRNMHGRLTGSQT